ARHRLREGHLAAALESEEVLMAEDVLEDLVIAPEPAAFEPCLRSQAVELGRLQELRVLGSSQQVLGIDVGAERSPRLHVDDAGEPTILAMGISCSPPSDRPSAPAASSTVASSTSPCARPVRVLRIDLQNARERAESKSSPARIRSTR